MILNVPFFPGKRYYCAQDCALMVLKYFYPDKEFDIEDISKKSNKHEQFGTMAVGLAKALKEYGLNVDFYCRNLQGEEPSQEDKEAYFDKYGNYLSKFPEFLEQAKKHGVNIYEKDFTINSVVEALKQKKVVIPEVNWNVISGKPTYQGHFVVIVGSDDEYIYFHNPGPNHPEQNKKVTKELMEKARDYLGTNKETIVISNKNV